MTRNPDKYNKNAERNRLRDIEGERRKIWQEAIRQAQRLAAVHDPSGAMFNVGRVIVQEDGSVITQEILQRREQRALEKAAANKEGATDKAEDPISGPEVNGNEIQMNVVSPTKTQLLENGINPDRFARIEAANAQNPPSRVSKSQLKKRKQWEPRPPPPKPIIPEGIAVPEGEENWVALWDLPDDELERRTIRAKRRKAADRKALRVRQQSGKAERRIARDEKRKVYRDIKLTWKTIKGGRQVWTCKTRS